MKKPRHGYRPAGKKLPTYCSWESMRSRCNNPHNVRYQHYGGRGIQVCERWNDFANFLEDMGERPKERTLGRFGDKGNYEPGNCAWQTPAEQRATQGSTGPRATVLPEGFQVDRWVIVEYIGADGYPQGKGPSKHLVRCTGCGVEKIAQTNAFLEGLSPSCRSCNCPTIYQSA